MQHSTIGIYIHVPYCKVACPYCDFVKKPIDGDAPDAFVKALCTEIRDFEGPAEAASVFFGGGTPSLLTESALDKILTTLRMRFTLSAPEISLEANPDDITKDRLHAWQDAGINRISLGVQSFHDAVLQYLGRCHDGETARDASRLVSDTFENWGMDLIFGAHPTDAWETDLREGLTFEPPHVSTYGLTYERKTPFWKRRDEAIDSDLSLDLYRNAISVLDGYRHYEVSNFAKPGFESAHNRIYWRNGEYAGFGPGAYSYVEGLRSRNSASIRDYLREPGTKSERIQLSGREIRTETLLQHFRTRRGLPREAYTARFGNSVEEDFGVAISALLQRGLLEDDGATLQPTPRGYELNDEIGLALVP